MVLETIPIIENDLHFEMSIRLYYNTVISRTTLLHYCKSYFIGYSTRYPFLDK